MAAEIQFQYIPATMLEESLSINKSLFPQTFKNESFFGEYEYFLCAVRGGELVGVAKIYQHPGGGNLDFRFIEVQEGSRFGGIGAKLIMQLFELAQSQQKIITADGFNEDGRSHLLKVIERCQQKYGNDSFQYIPRA